MIDQWTPGIRPTWSVAQVKSALYEHQTGVFAQSALLAEAMYADDEFPSSLDRAVNTITGAEFSLTPTTNEDGEPDPASEAQAAALAPLWEYSFPDHEVAKVVRWFLLLGVAIGTIDWESRGGTWTPHLRTLHPEFLWWDEGTKDPQTGRVGVFKYTHRNGNSDIVTPGDGKWVLLSDGRESWMRCSIRALATTWLVKQFAWRDWQRYNERHGLPIVKAMVPVMADADDRTSFFNSIRSMNSETTALLPTGIPVDGAGGNPIGYDLELLEAKDQAYGAFRDVIERCDRKIQVHFLGTNTNELIGTAGSRATSETGRNITEQVAAEREKRIVTDLRDQLVRPFMAFNVPNSDPALTPWPHYQVEGKEDAQKGAEAGKAFAEMLVTMSAAGYEVKNAAEKAEEFGLIIEEKDDGDMERPGEPANDSGDDDMGDDGEPGESDGLAQLAAGDQPPTVENTGKRDGAIAGQRHLDGLVDSLTADADTIERLDARRMVEIIDAAETEEELIAALNAEVDDASHAQMASVYEKAILMAQFAGMFSAQEDL